MLNIHQKTEIISHTISYSCITKKSKFANNHMLFHTLSVLLICYWCISF